MRIGLTGPIGAGKSTVAACWKDLGAAIVEGDAMGKLAVTTDTKLREELIRTFGGEIANEQGEIISSRLAATAFRDSQSQRELTRLTFPVLYRYAVAEMSKAQSPAGIVVFDAALIYEWEIEVDFDQIVVVTAPREKLITQAVTRLHITEFEANERLSRQIRAEEKAIRANYVIVNNGSKEDLQEKAIKAWNWLKDLQTS